MKKIEENIQVKPSLDLNKKYDVFISYASEDKQSFVEPLTKALKDEGIRQYNLTLPDIKASNSSTDTLEYIVSAMKALTLK